MQSERARYNKIIVMTHIRITKGMAYTESSIIGIKTQKHTLKNRGAI